MFYLFHPNLRRENLSLIAQLVPHYLSIYGVPLRDVSFSKHNGLEPKPLRRSFRVWLSANPYFRSLKFYKIHNVRLKISGRRL